MNELLKDMQLIESLAASDWVGYKKHYFTESSLSRLWQHMEDKDTSLGIISAFRSERSLKQNQDLTKKLKAQIRENGFGFIMLTGHWPETTAEGEKDVEEESFAIIADDEKKLDLFLKNIAKEYGQEGFLIKPKETNHIFFSTSNGDRSDIGEYHPDKIGKMYSTLRKGSHAKKSFVFESCWLHKSWAGLLAAEKLIENQEKQLQESSRSRLLQHIGEHDCGMVTASRGWIYDENEKQVELNKSENKARNLQLLGLLHSRGYNVTAVKGGYVEGFGTDDAKEVSEHTFFVVDSKDKGKLKQDLSGLGKQFFQDSILFIPKAKSTSDGKEIKAYLIGTSPRKDSEDLWPAPGKEELVGSFKSQKKGDAYPFFTSIRNSPFRFESITREFPWQQTTFFSRGYVAYAAMPIEKVKEIVENKKEKNNFDVFG